MCTYMHRLLSVSLSASCTLTRCDSPKWRERPNVMAVKPVTSSNYVINVFIRPTVSFFFGLVSLFHLPSWPHVPSPGPWHGSGPKREQRAVTRTHNTWTVECFSSSQTPLLSHGHSCVTLVLFFGFCFLFFSNVHDDFWNWSKFNIDLTRPVSSILMWYRHFWNDDVSSNCSIWT